MTALVARLRHNLEAILSDIADCAQRAGRDPAGVSLVAVTKYATAVETEALARALLELGQPVLLGESRVQALVLKAGEIVIPEVEWHLIGNLQRNKAAQACRHADLIHSFDRDEILVRCSAIAEREGITVHGLLQVNASGEDSKHGYEFEALPSALELASSLPGIEIQGLMGMAGRGTDHDTARPAFARMRKTLEELAPGLPHLSMGMSQDYRGAILEGATLVRIGSALFTDL